MPKNTPHKTKHPLYKLHASLLQRCLNPKATDYRNYGGRGITICTRWQGEKGFKNFTTDMGSRPTGTTLDRKKNSLGYSPDNCRWATRYEQMANTRNNTDFVGVAKCDRKKKKWVAQIKVNRKSYNLGRYETKIEAMVARVNAESYYFTKDAV